MNGNINLVQALGNNEISELLIDKNKNKWMIIKNKGVYVYNENSIVKVEEHPNAIPTDCKLYQNYPNPFNPVTTITFQIPKRNKVVLKVIDDLGREIETLVNEVKSIGNYSVKFDGSKYSSGIYFYQLITNEKIITKKFVLLK